MHIVVAANANPCPALLCRMPDAMLSWMEVITAGCPLIIGAVWPHSIAGWWRMQLLCVGHPWTPYKHCEHCGAHLDPHPSQYAVPVCTLLDPYLAAGRQPPTGKFRAERIKRPPSSNVCTTWFATWWRGGGFQESRQEIRAVRAKGSKPAASD